MNHESVSEQLYVGGGKGGTQEEWRKKINGLLPEGGRVCDVGLRMGLVRPIQRGELDGIADEEDGLWDLLR